MLKGFWLNFRSISFGWHIVMFVGFTLIGFLAGVLIRVLVH